MMGMIFLYWGIIYAVIFAGRAVIKHFDAGEWNWKEEEQLIMLLGSGMNGAVIWGISKSSSMNHNTTLLLTVLAGCLLFACFTDCKTCEVFQFTWWIAGAAGGLLLYLWIVQNSKMSGALGLSVKQQLISLLLYVLLQEGFFCKFYGRADCHAFVVCAVTGCALGMEMMGYLLHMTLAFGSLAVVQAVRGNINRKGNLKHSQAFLPYITISFWVLLFLEKSVILERVSEKIYIGGL